MKEVTFIRHNLDKWRGYESTVESSISTPDELADAYIDITSDLAFSQTHYPKSRKKDRENIWLPSCLSYFFLLTGKTGKNCLFRSSSLS